MNDHLPDCYTDYSGYCDCESQISEYLSERWMSDSRSAEVIRADAYGEDYDRDWDEALARHDRFCNQCEGRDQFGARCLNRKSHKGKHDATINGMLSFHYSPEKIDRVLYNNSPLLALVPR